VKIKEKPSDLIFAWSGHTDCGNVRKNNEDSFLGLLIDTTGVRYLGRIGEADSAEADFVFAVSDGMGGTMAGEFASKIAVEKITKILPSFFQRNAGVYSVAMENVLREVFAEIHRALDYLGSSYEECRDMGATLSLCWFTPHWLYFAHVGDSRIYRLPQNGPLKQITEDDTYVAWLYRNGQINEREAKNHPRRNVLQKSLGGGHQFAEPQVGAIALEPGDRFLLCTDGVTDGLYDDRLEEFLRASKDEPGKNIVRLAVEASGRDNTTAMVVDVLDRSAK
jgi:serine/threonine protein phosphatase PrpC